MSVRSVFTPGRGTGGGQRKGRGLRAARPAVRALTGGITRRDRIGGVGILLCALLLAGLCGALASNASAGDIFRYTAPDGSVLFTNMPLAPAERLFSDPPAPAGLAGSSNRGSEASSQASPDCPAVPGVLAPAPPPQAAHLIARFPLVRQKGPWCVAASAEMVLRFHGFYRQQDDIAFAAYDRRDSGTSLAAIARYINRIAGLRAWLRERTDFGTLKRCIDADVPVMVPLKEPGLQEGHLTVAIGYDDGRQFMTLAEPATGSTVRIHYGDFLRLWTGASLTVTPTRL